MTDTFGHTGFAQWHSLSRTLLLTLALEEILITSDARIGAISSRTINQEVRVLSSYLNIKPVRFVKCGDVFSALQSECSWSFFVR